MIMGSTGLGPENDCAGEDQQQFSRQSVGDWFIPGSSRLFVVYLTTLSVVDAT
jgi:hypothetical protein